MNPVSMLFSLSFPLYSPSLVIIQASKWALWASGIGTDFCGWGVERLVGLRLRPYKEVVKMSSFYTSFAQFHDNLRFRVLSCQTCESNGQAQQNTTWKQG